MKCVHCRRNKQSNSGRGLCRGCWNNPAIRNRYRTKITTSPKYANETLEELEALIQEQYKTLPEWWELETRRQRELEESR